MDINQFRSKEEFYFAHWLNELKERGYVVQWSYEMRKFNLIPAYSEVKLREVSYTPDFWIEWNNRKKHKLETLFTWVDVKGTFQKSQNDFPIKQKLMYMIHGIYVHKVEIPTFFSKTFAPEEYFYTPVKRELRKKIKNKFKTIEEWLSKE